VLGLMALACCVGGEEHESREVHTLLRVGRIE